MLFNKYQYNPHALSKRGYSQCSVAKDEAGKSFWVKWILGIDKSDTKAKILADRLRYMQKARHIALSDIIDYGFDEEQQTFAIVYEYLEEVQTLESKIFELKTQETISGLIDLVDCLRELHVKHKINHGDIHPANILIDKNGQFYIVDFGLADLTKTLSQTKELEIFARGFAAPEKLNKHAVKGFPFQADVFSMGKVVDWFYEERQEEIEEKHRIKLDELLSEIPSDRPSWQQVLDFLQSLSIASEINNIYVEFSDNCREYLLNNKVLELLKEKPKFEIIDFMDGAYRIDITLKEYICRAKWFIREKKLVIIRIQHCNEVSDEVWCYKNKYAHKLSLAFNFIFEYRHPVGDLTLYFKNIYESKEKHESIRKNRKIVKAELGFYTELLEQEKKVIKNNSLRLQYSKFSVYGDEILFYTKLDDKFSSLGFITKHIEEGNDVNSEGFEYVISANVDGRQNKEVVEFVGKPYDFDTKNNIIKIKDIERLKVNNIPQSGYLFENTAKKEEEKNRQLEAIRKVEKNEVQNPDLIYYLFKPDALPPISSFPDYLEKIWQKDKNGKPLVYSYNQIKAIQNALTKSPLSLIQGPPGTGKTTVITEIVFQILAKKPEAKILITSQTNNAVDQVLENLLKNEIPILRLSGITPPRIIAISKHTLEKKLEGWKKQVKESAEKNFQKEKRKFKEFLEHKHPYAAAIADILFDIKEWNKAKEKIENIVGKVQNLRGIHHLSNEKEAAIKKLDEVIGVDFTEFFKLHSLHKDWIATISSLDEKSAINQKLIDSIRVIGATCNHIASKKYSRYKFEFDYVIMDESGKATTAEALVPITLGNNLIFVGDHRQLKPMLTSNREVERWLRDKFNKEAAELENWEDYFSRPSLFEQTITHVKEEYKVQLTECRRSSEDQVKLTSKYFYEAAGDEKIVPVNRSPEHEHNLPLAVDSSIVFVDIGSTYENEFDKNKSSFNKETAKIIPNILRNLNRFEKIKEYSVGVITGYTAQFRLLNNEIKTKHKEKLNNVRNWNKTDEKFTVSIVDRFQGLERDIVIVDLVKSGPGLSLGFLEVPNRINVALSRQKKLLIIVGDYHGIISAKTRKREKAALQKYLEGLNPSWIVKADQLNELFYE
jgi:superfamily I DNA and/or RNA helicase/tRNA A-37 threonylcarbamoyl transferase component Bud32